MSGHQHASISDVAARARVSTATVSRALRGLPHVSESSRRRVLDAAAELDYVASPAGAGLATGRTLTIGLVTPLVARWFFSQSVATAESVLQAHGYDVLLYDLGSHSRRDRFFTDMPFRRKVDVRHLQELGHEDIAMISSLEDSATAFSNAPLRRAGFNRALGLTRLDHHHVVTGQWGVEGGIQAMRQLLARAHVPTARAGRRVPGDVSVIGFDDHELAHVVDLTTIRQPVKDLATAAAEQLLRQLRGEEGRREIVLPTQLVKRGSTAPVS